MNTDQLIDHLAERLSPVQPLRSPAVRAFMWLSGATAFVGLVAFSMTSPTDLATNGTGPGFVVPQLLAVATAILAAWAAFRSVVPGSSRTALVWPLVAGVAWIGSLATGMRPVEPGGLVAPREWMCVAVIVLSSGPLAAALWVLLRRGAPLHPAVTAALGGLSIGVLANVAACVSHPHTNNAVTLVWHGATIAALVGGAALTGHLVLKWDPRRFPAPETEAR